MPATHPVLGIIGGMGPDGTLELMRRIVAILRADVDRGVARKAAGGDVREFARIVG